MEEILVQPKTSDPPNFTVGHLFWKKYNMDLYVINV